MICYACLPDRAAGSIALRVAGLGGGDGSAGCMRSAGARLCHRNILARVRHNMTGSGHDRGCRGRTG